MRYNLNFNWRYAEDWSEDLINPAFDDSALALVNIPHANKEIPYSYFDDKMFQFVSGYRNTFTVPESFTDRRLVLKFEAVANYAVVYVNGVEATSHKGSYSAFEVDVTDLIKIGESNTITVLCDSTERAEIPPFGGVIDYLVYGGIYREVYLYAYASVYVSNTFVSPRNVLSIAPSCDVSITLNRASAHKVVAKIIDADGNVVAKTTVANNGTDTTLNASLPLDKVNLWDTENPYLYTMLIELCGESYEYKFGFREATFTKNGFFLNGKPLKIRGLNRHQSFPYVGYAMPASAQFADADYCKNGLGLNLVRTSHYPNSHHFLDRCDEIGLLVFTEIPGWQYVSRDNAEWRANVLMNVREMITQDYNHPSIIIWGVRINESSDDRELYVATNKLARELDSTRQTGGVRCFPKSELLEDVYTYNDFMHSGKNRALTPKFIATKSSAPLLITEHNGHMYPTKSFDHEKKRQNHALRHATVLNEAYKRKNTCGAIGWCMSDYNTHKDFGSGDKICYHGVSDMFRMDKLAAYLYKSQQDKYPVIELTSNMEIGDNAGGKVGSVYMFTNCDKVNLYKNNELINTIDVKSLAKHSQWKYLPHPPIELDDIIGDQIAKSGKFSKHDSTKVKKFLLDIKKSAAVGAIVRNPLTTLKLLTKYHLSIADCIDLFGQYVTGWGDKAVSYKLEGIKGSESVTICKESVTSQHLEVEVERSELIEDNTYDTCRISLRALSQSNASIPYSNEVINITTSGPIEIIGDTTVALLGGARAIWIKSTGKSGEGIVTITSNIGNHVVTLKVTKTNAN